MAIRTLRIESRDGWTFDIATVEITDPEGKQNPEIRYEMNCLLCEAQSHFADKEEAEQEGREHVCNPDQQDCPNCGESVSPADPRGHYFEEGPEGMTAQLCPRGN